MFNKGKKIILSVIAIMLLLGGMALTYNNKQQKEYNKALELIDTLKDMNYADVIIDKIDIINEQIQENLLSEEEVYAKLLKSKEWLKAHAGYDLDKETIRFLPLDVDKDGSLDLLLHHETGGYEGLTLSVISYNKKMDNISIRQINTSYGVYLGYLSDSNTIMTFSSKGGISRCYGWNLENNSYVKTIDMYSDICARSEEYLENIEKYSDDYDYEDRVSYKINGRDVSFEELSQYIDNLESRMSHKEMYELNDANIRNALGVEPKNVEYNDIKNYM